MARQNMVTENRLRCENIGYVFYSSIKPRVLNNIYHSWAFCQFYSSCQKRGYHLNDDPFFVSEYSDTKKYSNCANGPKSGKLHFWMATAPGTNMLSTNFWLIIVHPVRVKTYRSLKIKFFVKVKNKVHVTIGYVVNFARNYGPAQNDFKVNILWCVMEFCIEQYTDDGHIFTNNFIYFVWNSIVRIPLMQYFVWSRL